VFTAANILTISRIFIAPLCLVGVLLDTPTGMHVAVALFIIGALTDYFDGLLARRYGQETPLGMELDPLADKVLTTTAWVAMVYVGVMPLWMAVIIIARDFATTVLRSYAVSKGAPIVTSLTAKAKTMAQMMFIGYALVAVWLDRTNIIPSLQMPAQQVLESTATWWIALSITVFTVFTLVEYLYGNRRIFTPRSRH
jgi:CDP-diacylglycerol--glycerol-3-phosphate 3-phosphatidyltransferase